MIHVLSVSNDMNWVMGTGPQRKARCGEIAIPGWDVFLGPRLLFPCSQQGEGCLGSCPALGGAQTCISDSTCHEEAEMVF